MSDDFRFVLTSQAGQNQSATGHHWIAILETDVISVTLVVGSTATGAAKQADR